MPQADLYTTVVNLEATQQTFSFLPPHGRTLAAGEEVELLGDLVSVLGSARNGARKLKALEAALESGKLGIRKSPAHYLFDQTTGATKVLALDNSDLGAEDPSWGALVSE
jgi:hypothetical protein